MIDDCKGVNSAYCTTTSSSLVQIPKRLKGPSISRNLHSNKRKEMEASPSSSRRIIFWVMPCCFLDEPVKFFESRIGCAGCVWWKTIDAGGANHPRRDQNGRFGHHMAPTLIYNPVEIPHLSSSIAGQQIEHQKVAASSLPMPPLEDTGSSGISLPPKRRQVHRGR